MKVNKGSGNHTHTLKTSWNDVTGDFIKTGKGSQEKYAEGWDAIFNKKKEGALAEPLTSCASARDGDCIHKQCPQLRDNEPAASGRSCPLYDFTDSRSD